MRLTTRNLSYHLFIEEKVTIMRDFESTNCRYSVNHKISAPPLLTEPDKIGWLSGGNSFHFTLCIISSYLVAFEMQVRHLSCDLVLFAKIGALSIENLCSG